MSHLLCPPLQHTKSTPVQGGQDLVYSLGPANKTKLSAGTPTAGSGDTCHLQSWPYKGVHQSRQAKLPFCKRNQDCVKTVLSLAFILKGSQETNPYKEKPTHRLGHIHPSTGMGFQWSKLLKTLKNTPVKVVERPPIRLSLFTHPYSPPKSINSKSLIYKGVKEAGAGMDRGKE